MKKSVFFFSCFLTLQSLTGIHASTTNVDIEDLQLDEIELHEPLEKVKISDIRELLKGTNPDTTCLDEYLKRRKQLLIKFSLTPVTLTAAAAASFFVGGLAGVGVGNVVIASGGTSDPWALLGYAVGGVMIGTATSIVVVTADTAASGMNYYDNDLVMKTLAEYYLERPGDKLNKLYQKVTKKMDSKPTESEFLQKLIELDESGKLCDGSLVKQPRIRLGTKLKYQVARPSHLKAVF
ncbi:MAG TPA: hypothetical protein VKZ84_01495 [Bacteriovoracaceae bacterium]|nr:hypothetical protein [Bacteriovoracaceae bacterium]